MRSGTSSAGARAAASHTAALAGSDVVVDALFREAGVLRATTLQELLDTAVLLTSLPAPAGNRVAVLDERGRASASSAPTRARRTDSSCRS